MPAIATDATHGLARAAHGSLHAMKLGGQTLEQLAEHINWSNKVDFPSHDFNPWAALEEATASSSPIERVKDVAESKPLPIEIAVTSQVPNDVTAPADDAAELNTQHEDVLVNEPEAVTETEPIAETMNPAIEVEPELEMEIAASDEVFEEQNDAIAAVASTSETPSYTVVQEPVAAAPVIELTRRPSQDIELKRSSPSSAGRSAPKRIDVMSPKPMMPSSTAASGDQHYLQRLESLVLELNLQLARVNAPSDGDIDHTKWLSQRVIDLSLQNMALQEELAKRSHQKT
jgi:hypothetical protein